MFTKAVYLINNTEKNNIVNVLQQFKITCLFFFQHLIYSCDGKTEFSAVISQSSVSHDPSKIILIG